jgi:demethylmenaquinone methyltransferase/2-methoxy-6-polyprenyl-1,4-benzoquinol methylase
MPEGPAIAQMFSGIAPRYDLANHVLSLGMDFGWRRRLVNGVAAAKPRVVVDLATGSGDVAFALKKRLGAGVEVRGLDFCAPMLAEAEKKKAALPYASEVTFAFGDCMELPLANESVDVLTIAFGLRNLPDRDRGLREMRRVLRSGGRLFVLEFSQPAAWFRPLYYFYLHNFLPVIAGAITGQPDAYRYLNTSIAAFPDRATLAGEIRAAGFAEVSHVGLAMGSVAIHEARK